MLIVQPTFLLKSKSKSHLIPVQKQVVKNGKVFMQTFYVKAPETKKKAPNKNPIKTQSMPKAHPAPSPTFSNRPEGGVWITRSGYNLKHIAVKLPEGLVDHTFDFNGKTIIVHKDIDFKLLSVGSGYTATEASTGLSLGSSFKTDSAEDVEKLVKQKVLKDKFLNGIDRSDKIVSLPTTSDEKYLIDSWKVKDNSTGYSDADLDEVVARHFKYSDSTFGDIDAEEAKQVIKDYIADQNVTTRKDLILATKYIDDDAINYAVIYAVPLGTALEELETLTEIQTVTLNEYALGDTKSSLEGIKRWVDTFSDHDVNYILDDAYLPQVPAGTVVQPEYILPTRAEVLKYAINNDTSLEYSVTHFTEERNEYLLDLDNVRIKQGKTSWTFEDLKLLGFWVGGGAVKKTRDIVKFRDSNKYSESDIASLDGYDNVVTDCANVISEKSQTYSDSDYLYRGTKNPAWGEVKPGMVKELGVASFSKSREVADGFLSHYDPSYILKLVVSDYNDDGIIPSPVAGVDVSKMIEDSYESDEGLNMEGILQKSGVSAHANEEEFIVRSPAVEIIKVESIGNNNTEITVRTHKMDTIEYLKSLFSNMDILMQELDRTFDYPLSREPEVWNV